MLNIILKILKFIWKALCVGVMKALLCSEYMKNPINHKWGYIFWIENENSAVLLAPSQYYNTLFIIDIVINVIFSSSYTKKKENGVKIIMKICMLSKKCLNLSLIYLILQIVRYLLRFMAAHVLRLDCTHYESITKQIFCE